MVLACWRACSQTTSPRCSRSPRKVPESGGTATWRMPSMKAANTNSAFEGQRRYTVALLARALLTTASTVNPSYPCSCNSRKVTASSSASRGDHGDDPAHRSAVWVIPPTLDPPRLGAEFKDTRGVKRHTMRHAEDASVVGHRLASL